MPAIEVFKTNVTHPHEAFIIETLIHEVYPSYRVNFDLEDCDNIMRIKSFGAPIQTQSVCNLLNRLGFEIDVLEETQPELTRKQHTHG
jgi:hypothetical protein